MADFQQPPPVNPYDSPETLRPGMSSGAKVLIGLGIGCGVLLLLCCGFFGITAFYFGTSLQNATSEDPATIRRVTDSIVTIAVPAGLEPQFSFDWTVPLVSRTVSAAAYADREEHSALFLFQLDADLGDAEAMKAQFQDALRESGRAEWREVHVEDPETIEVEINGETAEFTLGKGQRKDSKYEIWQATGAFAGNGGPAMMFMQLDAGAFDKQQAIDVLRSMK